MKLIKSIIRHIIPATKQQPTQLHEQNPTLLLQRQQTLLDEQQQALQEQSVIINDLSSKEKQFRSELQFIYSILIQRQRCRIQLFPLLKQNTLLLALDHKITQLNFYLYIPIQQANEIAQVLTYVKDNTIVVHEQFIAPSHNTPDINNFLSNQINSEAKTLGLSVIYNLGQ